MEFADILKNSIETEICERCGDKWSEGGTVEQWKAINKAFTNLHLKPSYLYGYDDEIFALQIMVDEFPRLEYYAGFEYERGSLLLKSFHPEEETVTLIYLRTPRIDHFIDILKEHEEDEGDGDNEESEDTENEE